MLYAPKHHSSLERYMAERGMSRLHYTIEPEGTKVVAQMGHGFLSAQQSLAIARESA